MTTRPYTIKMPMAAQGDLSKGKIMTFYIIRHAHKEKGSFYNPRLRHQDEPISEVGREEACRLWSYFCNKGISAIYVSSYQRTMQTIEYVAAKLGIVPIIDERLNEIDNGCLDGMSDEAIQLRYPEIWRIRQERTADFRFPDGETGEEARQRIAGFLEEKRKVHANANIVLVSHEGLIRLLMCHIMNQPVYHRWNFHYVDFCGITEITYQPEYKIWKLIRFNQKFIQ
ncbi:MAG TPA: histidine phosphatase family protein [Anaerolineales bacterium]|nr:histidine phosphatase family protein [Anaerolineales bacterium]